MIELRLLPAVFEDVAEAARWYDEKGYSGLGKVLTGNNDPRNHTN